MRFSLRCPRTQPKKLQMHLDERLNTMIDNAFLYSNPPETTRLQRKERPPLHEYVRYMLYKELSAKALEAILKR